jgi:FkbM family methyltransferase
LSVSATKCAVCKVKTLTHHHASNTNHANAGRLTERVRKVARAKFLKLPKRVHQFLWWLGYELRPTLNHHWHLHQLQRLGFHPATVVDVGVGFGTPTLYQAFPTAYIVLLEPLCEFEPHLKTILSTYRGRYFLTALGARAGTRLLYRDAAWPERSSLYRRTEVEASHTPLIPREVPVTSLDALLTQHHFQPPFGLKIDAEGGELEIIMGARRFLQQTEFVIAEVAVADRFVAGYSFRDFIDLMHQQHFRVCELLDIGRSADASLTFVDLVFRRTMPPGQS